MTLHHSVTVCGSFPLGARFPASFSVNNVLEVAAEVWKLQCDSCTVWDQDQILRLFCHKFKRVFHDWLISTKMSPDVALQQSGLTLSG
ncbi:hypothetical protein AAFF_G00180480 [Aldrovandia affinis]|uniref:Uncharacterized protein n=1 Tax=Aldrovandia affinis TaxID=143900 RepID=A0AAD7WW01_9TELE|nr:hypothetical protein AAFF_G00180480 [Aldrovandia affinis]